MKEILEPPLENYLANLIDPKQRETARLAIVVEELANLHDIAVSENDINKYVIGIDGEYAHTILLLSSLDQKAQTAKVISDAIHPKHVIVPMGHLVKFVSYREAFKKALERFPFSNRENEQAIKKTKK